MSKDRIEKLEKKFEEKFREQEKEIEELKEENRKLKEKIEKDREVESENEKSSEREGISRRGFLKKLGAGAVGLGALSLSPASAFNIKDSEGLKVYKGGTQYLDASGDPVSITNANLRLATGQSIEDGSGIERVGLNSTLTSINDDGGDARFQARADSFVQLRANVGEKIRFRDDEGGFTAVQYDTDTSAGVLRTPNAGVTVQDSNNESFDGLNFGYDKSNNHGIIQSVRPGIGNDPTIYKASLHDFSQIGADLRLATGQAIEDGSGTSRIAFSNLSTAIFDEAGNVSFNASSGSHVEVRPRSGQPFKIADQEGGFDAVQYDTDPSTGILSLPNSDLSGGGNQAFGFATIGGVDVSGYANADAGEWLLTQSDGNISSYDDGNVIIESNDSAGTGSKRQVLYDYSKAGVPSSSVVTGSSGSYEFDNSANLRLATGQSIEDGSGIDRIVINSGYTNIYDESGNYGISLNDGLANRISARSNTPIQFRDQEQGGVTAVQYTTDASTGIFKTSSSGLVVQSDHLDGAGWEEGLNFRYDPSNNFGSVHPRDGSGNNGILYLNGDPVELRGKGGLIDMSGDAADLRLATGQAIEDGSGQKRYTLEAGGTRIYDEGGRITFGARNTDDTRIYAYSNQDFRIYDNESGMTAVEYTTNPSTGTLKLTNADLDASGQSITTDSLNGADIANASANDVPISNGDGTLTMGLISHSEVTGKSSNDHHSKTASASELTDVSADSNLTSSDWGDYEIQKNGTDGTGVINFKTT